MRPGVVTKRNSEPVVSKTQPPPTPQIGDDGTFLSVAVGALPSASKPLFALSLIHTPRRQSELQPDWRQTRRGGETAHRSPLFSAAAAGCGRAARKTRRGSKPGTRTGSPMLITRGARV